MTQQRPPSRWRFSRGNWRVTTVRFLVSFVLVTAVLGLLPSIDADFEAPLLSILLLSAVYSLLDAFVRPFLDVLLMPFVVQSFGLALVAVDILLFTLLLWLSGPLLDSLGTSITVEGLLPVLVGGLLLGLLKLAAEAVLGLTPPVGHEKPLDTVGGG